MAVTKGSPGKPKSPAKKRTLNNSRKDVDELLDSESVKSTPTKAKRGSESAARFRNTLMISEYREKNPHISIKNVDGDSQFDADEISSDDDVWIFQAPASIDVSKLAGQTFKLGSRSSTVHLGDKAIECVTEKYSEPKSMSMICTQQRSQMALVSFVPQGKVLLRSAVQNGADAEALDFDGLDTSVTVPMPSNLKVRHPLHGAIFEERLKLDKSIKAKLVEADSRSLMCAQSKKSKRSAVSQKADADDEATGVKTEVDSLKKKSRKRKLDSNADNEDDSVVAVNAKRAKTKIEADLDWIKQL